QTIDELASREGEARVDAGVGNPAARAGPSWDYEPRVAQAAFEQLLAEARVPVFLDEHLDRTQPLPIADGRILGFRTTEGLTVSGDVFVDATYEGDLMAAADVPFAIGREASGTYDETLAGVRPSASGPKAKPVSGLDAHGSALPGVQASGGTPGAADSFVQP